MCASNYQSKGVRLSNKKVTVISVLKLKPVSGTWLFSHEELALNTWCRFTRWLFLRLKFTAPTSQRDPSHKAPVGWNPAPEVLLHCLFIQKRRKGPSHSGKCQVIKAYFSSAHAVLYTSRLNYCRSLMETPRKISCGFTEWVVECTDRRPSLNLLSPSLRTEELKHTSTLEKVVLT